MRGLTAAAATAPPPGVRVVIDARALQEPDRAPLTAAYLDGLLGAFDVDPVPGESFAFLLASDADDPTERFLLVVAETHVNRRVLASNPAIFPDLPRFGPARIIRALSVGQHPPTGLIVL